jgi:hypothetical protein
MGYESELLARAVTAGIGSTISSPQFPQRRHESVTPRNVVALTCDWRHAGRAVEVGEVVTLLSDDAFALVQFGKARYV